jgi:hypothetical protein
VEAWRRTSRSCNLTTRWASVARLSVASQGLSHPPHHLLPHHAHATLTSTRLLAPVDLRLTHGLEVPPRLLTCFSELCHVYCIARGTDVANASVLPWRCHLHPATVNNLATIAVCLRDTCAARIDFRDLHQGTAVSHIWILLYTLL